VLTLGGRLLVSVSHRGEFPIVHPDLEYFGITEYTEDYDFVGMSLDLTFFHRPLSAMAESFAGVGLLDRRDPRAAGRLRDPTPLRMCCLWPLAWGVSHRSRLSRGAV